MTPDLPHSITTHRHNLRVIWRSGDWKAANHIFHDRHPDNTCIRCGKIGKILPGHSDEDYHDMPTYIQKVRDDQCDPLCPRCNRNEAKGKKPCPVCVAIVKAGNQEHIVQYIPQLYEVCFNHLPDSEKQRIWTDKRHWQGRKSHLHPCNWNTGQQRCTAPIRFSPVCDRSKQKADGCDYFMVRKKVRV